MVFDREIFEKYNLNSFVTLNQYRANPFEVNRKLPDEKGIYFVVYPHQIYNDMFLETGSGGFFKGKNPNIGLDELWYKWVQDTDILYVGKAGGVSANGKISNATLKERIIALLRFGNSKNVGHWGGRYLWQHKNSGDFMVYWYECDKEENPVELETGILNEFISCFNKLPFANLI